MTAFSFEVPIKYLQDFDDLQDYHFVLSLLCKDEDYFTHFQQKAFGDHRQIWLDNSFNETGKADNLEELCSLMTNLFAHKLIVPDDPTWSTDQIKKSYIKTCFHFAPQETITVVNSPEMKSALEDVGAKHLALSYHIRLPHYQNGGLPEDFKWAQSMHFLGLCSIDEIVRLRPPTCDTSMPIKIAMNNMSLMNWHKAGCPHIHTKDICEDFFQAEMTSAQISLARANIIRLKEICK